ncbi:MAG: hypothetical protein ACREIF_02525 [Chthoniobacterales bacterium]
MTDLWLQDNISFMNQSVPAASHLPVQRSPGSSKWSGNALCYFIVIALALKGALLIADPSPQLFLGDSSSYVHTAVTGWIPPDRSFLYGFLIRWLSVTSGSLFSLVFSQVLASSVSAGLVGWMLWRFWGTSKPFAAIATILCSLDPIQLMYERFVMAEAFSLMAALFFVSSLLLFVDNGRQRYLVFASVAGVVAVALRISFLPAVVALSFSAPVIRLFVKDPGQPITAKTRRNSFVVSLALITVCHFSLYTGYKLLNGRLSSAPPAYQYADGFSLLSAWCPVMTLSDLQAVGLSGSILEGTAPRTLESRRAHRWLPDGISAALDRQYTDPLKANALAKKLALHILQRDPLGVAVLGVRTYLRGWQRDVIKNCIIEDTGAHRPIPPDLFQRLERRFHIAVDKLGNQETLSKSYFARGIQWYRILLLTPILLVITTGFARRRDRSFLLVVTIYANAILVTAVGLTVDNSIRYLHPLGWTFFFLAGFWTRFFETKFRPHDR